MKKVLYEPKLKKLFARYGVQFAYLFGSRATGKGKIAGSDYDFAVSFEASTPRVRFKMRLKLMEELHEFLAPARVDLVVLDDTHSATLRFEVAITGRLMYEKNTDSRIDFEFRAMHEYEDFAPFLHAYNKAYSGAV